MNRRTWWGTVVLATFLALVAVPASAGTMPNGLMPNGLMPNGLMPNGLMPNGLMPNGLMPNGLMPNGLMPNGLMPNGLMPNGLMPNGLSSYAIHGDIYANVSGSDVTFAQWFDRDPPARDNFMKYFVRCAYDGTTEVTFTDAAGKTWRWPGGIGFAMTTLKAGQQMTEDEARWISSCLLSFVNTMGTHQYISLRGSPPNPEAQAALALTTNEKLFMSEKFGLLFADLGTTSAYMGACRLGSVDNWSQEKIDLVLGRTCDVRECSYTDPTGMKTPILNKYFGGCMDAWNTAPPDPILQFYPQNSSPEWTGIRVGSDGPLLHPLKTYGPLYGAAAPSAYPVYAPGDQSTVLSWYAPLFGFHDVAKCASDPTLAEIGQALCSPADAPFTTRFDRAQVIECGANACLGGSPFNTGGGATDPAARTFAMVDMVSGQAADWAAGGGQADLSQAVTALIRYSKVRTASAHVFVSGLDGEWTNVSRWRGGGEREDDDESGEGREWGDGGLRGGGGGPDIWPATGAGKWQWLQVYPVHIRHDPYLGSSLGRFCSVADDCTPGLGLFCTAGLCMKQAAAATDPATQPAWSCDGAPGQLQLQRHDSPGLIPHCIEQCTLDSQCQAGEACRTGRCIRPVAKARLAGAAMSESCTGPELFRGANEAGACSKTFAKPPKKHTVCPKKYEVGAPCLGSLVYGERKDVTGWFCRGGGEALYQCIAEDAPAIDAVGFVPVKPWCMPADATTFVGVCK